MGTNVLSFSHGVAQAEMNEIQMSCSPGGLTCSSKLLASTLAANPKVNAANFAIPTLASDDIPVSHKGV